MKFSTPFRHSLGFTLKGMARHIASIIGLLYTGAPFAVCRFIIFGVINAFQRVIGRRAESHIRQESLERLSPLFTNSNSSCAILRKGRIIRVMATCFDVEPSIIFRCISHFVGGVPTLKKQTSATLGIAIHKMRCLNAVKLATITLAQPIKSVVPSLNGAECQEPPKALSSDVLEIMVSWFWKKFNVRILVGHIVSCTDNVIKAVRDSTLFQPFYIVQYSRGIS